MIYVILLVAVGILAPDLYIWDNYVRGGRAIWSVIYWVPSLLFVVLAVFALAFKRFSAGLMNISPHSYLVSLSQRPFSRLWRGWALRRQILSPLPNRSDITVESPSLLW